MKIVVRDEDLRLIEDGKEIATYIYTNKMVDTPYLTSFTDKELHDLARALLMESKGYFFLEKHRELIPTTTSWFSKIKHVWADDLIERAMLIRIFQQEAN